MAEYITLPFKQFARDFFLYTTYFPLYQNERDSLKPALQIQHAKTAVLEMSSVFSPYMRQYVFERTENVVLRTDEDLLRFLLPKCMRIYTPQSRENLLVMMSFIHEFLLYLQMNRLCYRFHFTAYNCLDAVIKRVNIKWTKDRWNNFWDHVRRNLNKMRPDFYNQEIVDEETLRMEDFQTSMVDIFQRFERDNDGGFELNYYELSMCAKDAPENDPDEEDDDPFVVDLKPNPDLLNQRAGGFEDIEMGIPISSLLPVPPYSRPRTYSDELPGDPSDEECKSNIETRTGFTKFEIYTSVMMNEAANRYGSETFKDKLLQRKCEYCGIKCYRFSYNLFKKQRDLALVRKVSEEQKIRAQKEKFIE